MKKDKNKLMDIRNSCKLTALKQLLHGCGIGSQLYNIVMDKILFVFKLLQFFLNNNCILFILKYREIMIYFIASASSSVVSEHRALLFCKHKNMMDVIEHSLFKQHLPELTYTRLDASLQANQRFSVVNKCVKFYSFLVGTG